MNCAAGRSIRARPTSERPSTWVGTTLSAILFAPPAARLNKNRGNQRKRLSQWASWTTVQGKSTCSHVAVGDTRSIPRPEERGLLHSEEYSCGRPRDPEHDVPSGGSGTQVPSNRYRVGIRCRPRMSTADRLVAAHRQMMVTDTGSDAAGGRWSASAVPGLPVVSGACNPDGLLLPGPDST